MIITPRCLVLLLSFIFSVFSYSSTAASKAQHPAKNPVADLQTGQSLYYFYLNDALNALTLLAIKDKKPYFNHSPKRPLEDLLLETGLKLDFQMSLSADVMLQKQAIHHAIKNTDKLWLYLGQRFYQKQLFTASRNALDRIQEPEDLNQADLWYFLQLQLALQTQPHEKDNLNRISNTLNNIDEHSIYYSYGANNLAISLYQQEQIEKAFIFIDKAISLTQKSANKETQQLHQHMLIAAAFMHFYQEDHQAAAVYFKQLSTDSLFVDQALLGFGQLAVENGDAELAIHLWEYAQEYPLASKAKIKSLNNMALLWEDKNKLEKALEGFEQVDQLCSQHLSQLDDLKARNDNGLLLKPILHFHKQNTLHSQASNSPKDEALFNQELRDTEFLLQLINNDAYLTLLQHYQDLQQMQSRLLLWQKELPLYMEIINSKKQAFSDKQAWGEIQQQKQIKAPYIEQYQQFEKRLQAIETSQDPIALLSENQLVWHKKIQHSENTLTKITNDPFYEEYKTNIKHIKGALIWQASEQYHQALWYAQQQLKILKTALEQKEKYERRFQTTLKLQGRFDRYENQLSTATQHLLQRLKALQPLTLETQLALDEAFLQQWLRERQSILNLQKSSRIAIARLSENFMQVDNE